MPTHSVLPMGPHLATPFAPLAPFASLLGPCSPILIIRRSSSSLLGGMNEQPRSVWQFAAAEVIVLNFVAGAHLFFTPHLYAS
jgi:hypothetical protein